jgi:hypothetical protein
MARAANDGYPRLGRSSEAVKRQKSRATAAKTSNIYLYFMRNL